MLVQYLAIQNNSKPNPQRLIVLDGLWEIESALDAGLELVAVVVSPELFRGNRAEDVVRRAQGGDRRAGVRHEPAIRRADQRP